MFIFETVNPTTILSLPLNALINKKWRDAAITFLLCVNLKAVDHF